MPARRKISPQRRGVGEAVDVLEFLRYGLLGDQVREFGQPVLAEENVPRNHVFFDAHCGVFAEGAVVAGGVGKFDDHEVVS